jgi:hypothetical protein
MGSYEFITTHYYQIVVMGINNSMLYIMGSNEFITTHYRVVMSSLLPITTGSSEERDVPCETLC